MDSRIKRREREWQQRHEEILAAAGDLFATQGFDSTTVQSIAQHSGFSVGYLYKHFAGKQELLDELMETHIAIAEEIFQAVEAEAGLTPLQRYRRALVLFCRHIDQYRRLVPVFMQHKETGTRCFNPRMEALEAIDTRRIEQAVAAGELPETDAALLAAVLRGMLWQLIKHFTQERPNDSLEHVPELIDELVLNPLCLGTEEQTRKDPSSS